MNPKLRFFDCNCSVGRTSAPILLDIPDAAGLRSEMAQAGVEEALVYHTVARDASAPLGNARLAEELRGHPELHPVWVLLPHHTGEMARPAELRRELRAAGVQAVRMYPGRADHSFSLAEWCCGELLAALEEAALPLLLDVEIVSWEETAEILGRHPGLPLVAANCSYRHDRYLYPLLERHPNLHIELSRFMGGGELEDVVRRFGARPLLFGTNMPVYTGTAAVSLLTYADIDWEAKEDIAGGNLRRLLEGDPAMSGDFDRIQAGLPLEDYEIIDAHAHLGPYYNMRIAAADAGSIVKVMDRCGIAKSVFSPSFGFNADFVLANSVMLQTVRAHRGRLYGACSVNGNYPELSLAELDRCFADPSVVMIKVHPMGTKCRLDDKGMDGIYAFAAKRKLLVLSHTWVDGDPHGNVDLFAAVAAGHPGIPWVMGHSGGPFGSRRAVELALKTPNIHLDITLSMCPARQIEYFVKEVGSARVLFGTDNPFIDPRPQIGRVGLAAISRQDKINIFGANARRLLALA